MTRKEQLQYHMEKLASLQDNLRKAQEEWQAHGQAFNAWLHAELGFPQEKQSNVLLAEILAKWDETGDHTPKADH